jgi:hypothetical protein
MSGFFTSLHDDRSACTPLTSQFFAGSIHILLPGAEELKSWHGHKLSTYSTVDNFKIQNLPPADLLWAATPMFRSLGTPKEGRSLLCEKRLGIEIFRLLFKILHEILEAVKQLLNSLSASILLHQGEFSFIFMNNPLFCLQHQ